MVAGAVTITTKQLGASLAIAILVLSFSASTGGESKTYKLYFLGGQSNMVGYGRVSELPDEMIYAVDRVMIFEGRVADDGDRNGGTGLWAPLQPGHGFGFQTGDDYLVLSDRFGPELSFGHALSSQVPDARFALVKYARGGSGLAPGVGFGSWHPSNKNGRGINQFDHALRTLQNAFSVKDIDGDGVRDRLVPAGIIWMQGESDANNSLATAKAYESNLTELVWSLRNALGSESLPVVIGKITDSGMADDGSVMDFIAAVQESQARVVDADECAELVTITDSLNHSSDAWHYDSEGFLKLGKAFAEAVIRLENTCSQGQTG